MKKAPTIVIFLFILISSLVTEYYYLTYKYERAWDLIRDRTPLGGAHLAELIDKSPEILNASESLYTGDLRKDIFNYTLWVHKHIRYNEDSSYPYMIYGDHVVYVPDVWEKASDTIRRGYGDCEDMAILLASIIRASYNVDVFIIVIHMEGRAHAALLIPSVNEIADPTIGKVFSGENILFVWYEHIMAPEDTYVAFIVGKKGGEDFYMQFSSNLNFLEWYNNYPHH